MLLFSHNLAIFTADGSGTISADGSIVTGQSMRISITQRIAIGLLLVIGLLLILILFVHLSVQRYRDNSQLLSTYVLPQSQLTQELIVQENTVASETLHYLLTDEDYHLRGRTESFSRTLEILTQLQEAVNSDLGGGEDSRQALATVTSATNDFIALTDDAIARRQRGELLDLAQFSEQIEVGSERVVDALSQLILTVEDDRQQALAVTQSNPLSAIWALGVLALLTNVGLFVMLVRTVVVPLRTLRDATLAVAEGDLSRQVQITNNDELGDLSRAFNRMIAVVFEQQQILQSQVALANAALEDAEAARTESALRLSQIEEQQQLIREMSVPVLPIGPTLLAMPLVGALDGARLQTVQEQALRMIELSRARHLLLDITGVPVVDAQVAQGMLQVVQAARLLGAEVILVGIRPEVAEALVGLGVELHRVATRSTLQSGIDYVQEQDQLALRGRPR